MDAHDDSKIYELADPLNVSALKRKKWKKEFDVRPENNSVGFYWIDLKSPKRCHRQKAPIPPNWKDAVDEKKRRKKDRNLGGRTLDSILFENGRYCRWLIWKVFSTR